MGCWNETCAVTNTPIRYGASNVKLVLFKPLHMANPEHYQYHIDRMVSEPSKIRKCFVDVFSGRYNDYGSLECSDIPDGFQDEYKYFFVHGDVWDAVVAYVQSQIDNPDEYSGWEYKYYFNGFENSVRMDSLPHLDGSELEIYPAGKEKQFKETLYVLYFLSSTRRNPWIGDKFRGSQSMNLEEHKLIAEQIVKIAEAEDED